MHVCGKKKSWRHKIFLHRFPKDPVVRKAWLSGLHLTESEISPSSRVRNLHFRDGNSSNMPLLSIGEKFGSWPSLDSERMQRLKKRYAFKGSPQPPVEKQPRTDTNPIQFPPPLIATAGEVLGEHGSDSDCHEIACFLSECSNSTSDVLTSRPNTPASIFCSRSITPASSFAASSYHQSSADLSSTVNVALVARMKVDTSQICHPKEVLRIEDICFDDSLVRLYTGFPSNDVLLAFFDFLGPAAHHRNYIGSKSKGKHHRRTKPDPLNQLFMTLGKAQVGSQ